ncbi:NUDIX domain-containing protein [Candidatus Woesearchaeota archaeon]|nr:NUDIX domain-containing protein [Candidatus Woesearchaeota archaeon]
MEHDIQRSIILKLIHNPSLSFNELWDKQGESNKFAYHVNKLEAVGLIVKIDDGKYRLTDEGRKLSAFIEGDTGGQAAFPTLTIFQLVWHDGKLLCQKRLKEPFYGTWGFVSGKQNFGWNIIECAKRDLKEETDLEADVYTIKGIEQVKTFDNGKLLFHHFLIAVETHDPKGTLKAKTHKAEHVWLTPGEYKAKPKFPETWPLDDLFYNKKFQIVEGERTLDNGKVISGKLVSKTEF